jgi:hypothetical protein
LALTAMLLFGEIADKTYVLFAGGALILLVAVSIGAFTAAGLLLDPTLPLGAFLMTNLVVLAERSHREVLLRDCLCARISEPHIPIVSPGNRHGVEPSSCPTRRISS